MSTSSAESIKVSRQHRVEASSWGLWWPLSDDADCNDGDNDADWHWLWQWCWWSASLPQSMSVSIIAMIRMAMMMNFDDNQYSKLYRMKASSWGRARLATGRTTWLKSRFFSFFLENIYGWIDPAKQINSHSANVNAAPNTFNVLSWHTDN